MSEIKQVNKNALTFIIITLIIDCTGLGLIIPVIPNLISELTNQTLSESALYAGYLSFSYAIMQFLFAPVMGNLSDKYGRRPLILLSLFGLGLDYLFLAIAPTITLIFVGRIISGIFGASFTTASAYIADVSPPDKRAQNFGLIGVAFGVGFILGPAIGGIFAQFGTRIPFVIAACLSLTNVIYGYFVLPESLPKSKRRPFDWRRANPIGAVVEIRKFKGLGWLLLSVALLDIAGMATQSTWTFYTMFKFEWNTAMVGISLAVVGVLIAFVQGFLIRIITPRIGEKKSVIYGYIIYIISFILIGLVTQGWMLYIVMSAYALGGICGPALQSLISNKVSDDSQGELQGIFSSMMSIAEIIGPLFMTELFYLFTKESTKFLFPGAPFIAAAAISVVALFIIINPLNQMTDSIHELPIVENEENQPSSCSRVIAE